MNRNMRHRCHFSEGGCTNQRGMKPVVHTTPASRARGPWLGSPVEARIGVVGSGLSESGVGKSVMRMRSPS